MTRIPLAKMALRLAVAGVVLALLIIVFDGPGWALGMVAVMEVVALGLGVIQRQSTSPRGRRFYTQLGLAGGILAGPFAGAYLFCALWGTGSHMDGCGVAGLFLGPWIGGLMGALCGWLLGWVLHHPKP